MSPETDMARCGPAKSARRGLVTGVIAASIAVHVAAAVVAGVWVVVRQFVKKEPAPPPAAVALPSVKIPPPEPERSLNPAASAGGAPKAAFADRIQALHPGKISLPKLPKVPLPGVSAGLDALPASSLLSNADLGGVEPAGGGLGGGTGTGVSFLGVHTQAKRIVLMYDVSTTVAKAAARAGMPMERIRDETANLVTNLGVNTRFTLVEFARNYAFFSPELLPATKTNREAAQRWLHSYFALNGSFPAGTPGAVTGSPGFLVALEAVFQLRPDSVFIISDGSMQRGQRGNATIPIAEIESRLVQLQGALSQPAGIFFIGVGVTPENEKALRKALAHAGGRGAYSQLER